VARREHRRHHRREVRVLGGRRGCRGEQARRQYATELVVTHGPWLAPTVVARTGSDGQHILLEHPGWKVPNSTQNLGPGLDVRGDGGYIVVAPSLHKSGNKYRRAPGHAPWERKLAGAPPWLLELLKPRQREAPAPGPRPRRCPSGGIPPRTDRPQSVVTSHRFRRSGTLDDPERL
jgi:hypothetical protein